MRQVQYPDMRAEVIAALQSLADPRHQSLRWGVYDPDASYYDDLNLVVHILYDDCQVLPDPEAAVGTVLFPEEVESLQRLAGVLDPMLDALGDRADAEYLASEAWPNVVRAAGDAIEAMRAAGDDPIQQ
jgi:hypothetical protein